MHTVGLTVEQIAERFSDRLSMRLHAGENGVKKVVERLAVMETADFDLGAQPEGMLVLTTLSFIEGAGVEPVIRLMGLNPAALAVKTSRYVAKIPQEIEKAAEEYAVPLFEISGGVFFSEAIRLITAAIVSADESPDNQTRRRAQILEKYMNDEPLEIILDSLGRILGKTCFFIDIHGDLLGSCLMPGAESEEALARLGAKLLKQSFLIHKRERYFYCEDNTVFPCLAGGNMLGVLVILGMRTLTEECEELVLQTLSYITVRVCERKIAEQGERAAAGSVLDEVLFQEHKSAEIIRRRLENDGFQLQELYAFVILSLREPEPRSARFGLVEFCCSQIERSFENLLIRRDRGGITCLVSFREDSPLARKGGLATRIIAFTKRIMPAGSELFDIGFSLVQSDPSALTDGFLQAQSAITRGRIYRPEKHIYDYASFIMQGILAQAKDTQEYKWLKKNVADALTERDSLYESGLWDALGALFRLRSLKLAADELHIHISTLRYRLQKIKDITGLDFFSAYGNYVLHTAYLIWMEQKN